MELEKGIQKIARNFQEGLPKCSGERGTKVCWKSSTELGKNVSNRSSKELFQRMDARMIVGNYEKRYERNKTKSRPKLLKKSSKQLGQVFARRVIWN